jgi:hypothetical protein
MATVPLTSFARIGTARQIHIEVAHGNAREARAKATLEGVLSQYDRQLIGDERTKAVINSKGHYTWIYATVLRDEPRIAGVAARHSLHID